MFKVFEMRQYRNPLRGKKEGVGLFSLSTIPYRLRRTTPIRQSFEHRNFDECVIASKAKQSREIGSKLDARDCFAKPRNDSLHLI